MACLLALKRHRECLSFVTKEVEHGTTNADVYILRARLYNFFQQVERGCRAGGWTASLSGRRDDRRRMGCRPALKL